jgi:hypothetical protein
MPIIVGCFISTVTEVSFVWAGFNYAMASNLGMAMRGIYSKKCLQDFKGMDGINLCDRAPVRVVFLSLWGKDQELLGLSH